MQLDRDQLRQIIADRLAGQKVVAAETEDDEDGVVGDDAPAEGVDYDLRSASMDALRTKIAEQIGAAPDAQPLRKASQFVIVGPDDEDELTADRTAPARRITVVSSETQDIIAKQG